MNSLLFLKEKCVRAVDLSEFVSSMCDKKQRKRLLGSDTGSEKKRKEGKEEDRAISSGGDMGGEGGDKVREGGESGEQTVTEMEYTPTGMEEVQKEVQWGEALMDIHSLYGFKPSLNRTPYVPLMQVYHLYYLYHLYHLYYLYHLLPILHISHISLISPISPI